jgi:hypothetical protein
MTPVFVPSGISGILSYADDSTEASTSFAGATAILVFNPDAANVVVVSVGFTDGDTDAIVPTSEFNGSGCVVGPQQQLIIGVPQKQNYAGNVFVSVAGVSATGNVFLTPGAI